ncbi:MAG: hypothetical protein LBJ15_00150 [Comamonas sp.]|uniref:hypothetical protein n=1 Tax=Comamonas sp. TaxID=34028 RepID=UPI002832BC56|nr:hypothetical protein [Comamonas sp.]MDR0212397.1 hypothetical protein [Comamonas sp.]
MELWNWFKKRLALCTGMAGSGSGIHASETPDHSYYRDSSSFGSHHGSSYDSSSSSDSSDSSCSSDSGGGGDGGGGGD